MLQLILNWLRVSVKNAFLAGVNDAISELDQGRADGEKPALESLKARFAISEEKPRKKAS